MKKKLTNNLGLKILALICSIILWIIVVNIDDPIKTRTITGVRVDIINADAVLDEDKVYDVLENTDVVTVTLHAQRSVLESLDDADVHAYADLKDITLADTVKIEVYTTKYNSQITKVDLNTENLKLKIENKKRKQLIIQTIVKGELPSNYIRGEVKTDQTIVRLEGPESIISLVESAEAEVEVSDITTADVSTEVNLVLRDADGNVISSSSIKKNIEKVKVNIEILATKEVPLVHTAMGKPADGFALTGVIESTPGTVRIAGKQKVLDAISQIEIPESELNVTGQNSDMTVYYAIKQFLPNNTQLADSGFSGNVKVTVFIEPEVKKEFTVLSRNLAVKNVPEEYDIEIEEVDDKFDIEIIGLVDAVNALSNSNITAYVDVLELLEELGRDELQEGSYHTELIFDLPLGTRIAAPVTVRVIAKLKETE